MENKQPKISTVAVMVITIIAMSSYHLYNGGMSTGSYVWMLATTIPFLLSMWFGEERPGVTSILNIFKTVTQEIALGKITKAAALSKLEVLIESAVDIWDGIFNKEEVNAVGKEIEKEIDKAVETKLAES